MGKSQTFCFRRSRFWQFDSQRCIHFSPPRQVSPCIICRVLFIMLLPCLPVRICNPMTLFHPEPFCFWWTPLRFQCNQNKLCPRLHHCFSQRHCPRSIFFIHTCGMDHFVNEHACHFFCPIDKDSVSRTDLRISPIHMLWTQVLTRLWELAGCWGSKPCHVPRLSIRRRAKPFKNARPKVPRGFCCTGWHECNYTRECPQVFAETCGRPSLIRIPYILFQTQFVILFSC